jgi:YidC/Oxa1 family membrane protein insertase
LNIWSALVAAVSASLEGLRNVLLPVFGAQAYGVAIVLLTVAVRVLLLPLAVQQFHQMRGLQSLQPEIKRLQEKYRGDRERLNQEVMRLYRERGVNPLGGCLPILLQLPIFFAIFSVLRDTRYTALQEAPFLWAPRLGLLAEGAGWFGYLLVGLVGLSTYLSSRQAVTGQPQSGQQQFMGIAMAAVLTFFALKFPVGVLVYWLTTNFWQVGQQFLLVRATSSAGEGPRRRGKSAGKRGD